MLALLSWMKDDFIVAGPAALLASIYFAPNSPPRKRLFKHLFSPNRQRAVHGVRNTSWDLTHLSEMIRKVNELNGTQTRLLFASFDKGLRTLARMLFHVSGGEFSEALLVSSLEPWWSRAQAEQIAKALAALLAGINDESRKQRQANSPISIDEMIRQGELRLLSFQISKSDRGYP